MGAYDPETLIILRNALDEAWALLSEDRRASTLKSDVASRILRSAAEGERDPVRLRSGALNGTT